MNRDEAEKLDGYGSGSMDWLKSPTRLAQEYGSSRKDLQVKAEQDTAEAALNQQKAVELGMQNTFNREAIEPIVAELQALKSKDIYNRTAQVVDASLRDGKYEDAWNSFLSDPSVKGLYQGMNVQSVQTFNPYNEAHVRAYRQSGMPEEVLNYLLKGTGADIVPTNENGQAVLNEQKVTPEDLKAIAMAYPLVQGLDNSIRVQPLGDFMASTGILKGVLSATDKQRYLDVVDQGINTLGKVAKSAYDSKLAKEKAEKEKLLAEAGETAQKAEGLKYDNQIKEKILSGDGTAESKAMEILKLTDPKTYAMLQKSQVELQTAEVGLETARAKLVETGKNIKLKDLEIGEKKEERADRIITKVGKIEALDNSIATVDKLIGRAAVLFPDGVVGTVGNVGAEFIPGSKTSDFFKSVETIDSQLWMDAIKEMKGLGALSNTEGDRVAKAIANLKSNQSKSQIIENLNVVKKYFNTSKQRAEQGIKIALDAGDTIGGGQPKDATPKVVNIGGKQFTVGQKVTNKNGTFLITENGPKKVN